jgi:hypothetical protein
VLTRARLALAAVACIVAACGSSVPPQPADRSSRSLATRVPIVRALDLSNATMDTVLQALADEGDSEVTFSACDDWLSKRVSIQTNEPKTVGVVMAMIVTQTGAAASLDGNQWTLFCRQADGSGRLFRRKRAPEGITVPKEPESPK